MKSNCIYFVEGECEAKLIEALKTEPKKVLSGRVKVFNVIEQLIPRSQLLSIRSGTTVVFVFDTDVPITDKLKKNIELIKKYCNNIKIVYLPQELNLEDELVRCTDIKKINELTNSAGTKEFKRDFCSLTNCRDVLNKHQLDVLNLWNENPPEIFGFVPKNSKLIKL